MSPTSGGGAVPAGGRWLDVGCGTGALSGAILAAAAPTKVTGIDASPAYVAHARARLPDPGARFAVGDARALPVPTAYLDPVVSGLVLNFVPDPVEAVAETARGPARRGGRGLRLGLRGRDGADAPVLGRSGGARPDGG